MSVCDPMGDTCDSRTIDPSVGPVLIGGEPYAS